MTIVSYEGRKYQYAESGWTNEQNVFVPLSMYSFLQQKAIEDGADPSLFNSRKIVENKVESKPKAKRTRKKKLAIKVFDRIKGE
jgi:hypothetical protein